MPETDSDRGTGAGDADSRRGLWLAMRRFFDQNGGERSLRREIEDKINERDREEGNDDDADGDSPGDGDLSREEREMVRNLLHFSEHDADDVAIPRGQIIAVEASASWAELLEVFTEHGHSRLPVYREQLDDVIGMIHIKDVFPYLTGGKPAPADWTSLMRQPLYVPQSRGALDVLADMRGKRIHLAIVVDEFSGTDGIITIEDLVEEIVGEIEDEHDDAAEEWIQQLGEGLWEIDARAELEDIAKQIDPALAEVEESVDTMGGLTFILAEQVPQVGAQVEHPNGWMIEVIEGDETHVKRVRLHARPEAATASEEE
ncbi:hemolysin family protein [Citromicrobium bathyomarinum]|uniref:hemolysin family protein n=1 Tax=Citromicrobium bathyomarinum TaxID=72174 RepID=UPI003CC92105